MINGNSNLIDDITQYAFCLIMCIVEFIYILKFRCIDIYYIGTNANMSFIYSTLFIIIIETDKLIVSIDM